MDKKKEKESSDDLRIAPEIDMFSTSEDLRITSEEGEFIEDGKRIAPVMPPTPFTPPIPLSTTPAMSQRTPVMSPTLKAPAAAAPVMPPIISRPPIMPSSGESDFKSPAPEIPQKEGRSSRTWAQEEEKPAPHRRKSERGLITSKLFIGNYR
jgi:hypothetical protein